MNVTFDERYYDTIMREFGYDPISFGQIKFSLGTLSEDDLQRKWLCHHGGDQFANALRKGEPVIVSTGFGLSGTPHIGTLSQILRAVALQRENVPVQMVLGDLDAYNGKAKPLSETLELAERYTGFVKALGFKDESPSILRSQYDHAEVLRTAYIIGHYMDDGMFDNAEEDLHKFYASQGKVDETMSYRRKLSLNLMTADFIHLHSVGEFTHVMVMLGIDEHKYVEFGRETVRRMQGNGTVPNINWHMSGMYSGLIKGLYGYPKMSKSFPDSGITVDLPPEVIRKRIFEGEGESDKPENNVIYQMMAGASVFAADEMKRNYDACRERGSRWHKAKCEYADMLIEICAKWQTT